MNATTWIHIVGGMIALAAGTVAVAVRKGGGLHGSAGTWFSVSMLVLGVTASMLAPFKSPPDSPIGGIMVCYFVATAWMTAHRRSGTPGWFERIACAIVLAIAIAIIASAFEAALSPTGQSSGPPGPGVLFALGGVCLLAGLSDLKYLRGRLSARQRISRHLWRMCFALFIATGSFFLGQQDVLPQAMRGSPLLFVPALAPFAVMLFWLVRLRVSGMVGRLSGRRALAPVVEVMDEPPADDPDIGIA
jgi:hypothetical protein